MKQPAAGPDPRALLRARLAPLAERLHGPELEELLRGFVPPRPPPPAAKDWSGTFDPVAAAAEAWCLTLLRKVELELRHITELHGRNAEFSLAYAQAQTRAEKRRRILQLAAALGASRRQLRGDRRAFGRWFDAAAVVERYQRRVSEAESRLAFFLERLGALVRQHLEDLDTLGKIHLWRRLELGKALLPLFQYPGDKRVVAAALSGFAEALGGLDPELGSKAVSKSVLQAILHTAQRARGDAWCQCAALDALARLSPEASLRVLENRLRHPGPDADLFVRRHILRHHFAPLLEALVAEDPASPGDLVEALLDDPSPWVRQALAGALSQIGGELRRRFWPRLAREDPCPQVRARALLTVPELVTRAGDLDDGGDVDDLLDDLLEILVWALREDADEDVVRVALEAVVDGHRQLRQRDPDLAERWYGALLPEIEAIHVLASKIRLRRWAAFARERLWLERHAPARELAEALRPIVAGIRPGTSRRLPRGLLAGRERALIGRVLAVLTIDDFGLELERGWLGDRLTRGPVLRFRLWRFLYEWRHPKPDKRQAHRHTIGRVHYGQIRAPSAILEELAQTTVPGEPLFMAAEDGWRPYLPLVDDVLSSLHQLQATPETIRFFTSEGVTEVDPPSSRLGRLRAWLELTRRFDRYATLRNWQEDHRVGRQGYLAALGELGFHCRFRPHAPDPVARPAAQPERPVDEPAWTSDPEVLRFFPQAAPWVGADFWTRFREYLLSPYENDLTHLSLFLSAALGLFLARHAWVNRSQRRARQAMALVVGGWGTRGKSGTERIKAAMLNAVGASLFSKTTGCEAMFVEAPAFGKMLEIFLYRPYDKATIWEQRNVVRLAARRGARVFLWECMGLTPAYVEILQRHWMRDDISTLTNTYPDHEDLQGPAGYDVAETMTSFLPRRGKVVTTEELMLPILREGAVVRGTEVVHRGWREAWLLTDDVLERFPYNEHPTNIALVLGVAEELGIDEDFALKEMADRVVPDLGVLRTFARSTVRTRTLEFVMGNSANEHHGAMGNWQRMGFADHGLDKDPEVWVTTVVNNRADRVPRSQVFAAILAREVSADRHILIGGNLQGLTGYLRDAWIANRPNLTLWREGVEEDGLSGPRAVLLQLTKKLREPWTLSIITARLSQMLGEAAADVDLDALCTQAADDPDRLGARLTELGVDDALAPRLGDQLVADMTALGEYRAWDERLREVDPSVLGEAERAAIDDELEGLLWRWFEKKIVVIDDYWATGDQILDRLVDETPPNTLTRIMGMQNIKGTGLDFVYRWEAWQSCYEACQKLLADDTSTAEEGLRELATFTEHGLLTEEAVRNAVETARHRPVAQNDIAQAELDRIEHSLERSMEAVQASLGGADEGATEEVPWREAILSSVEALADALWDSIRRRRFSDRIYRDLADERIARSRARVLMQACVKRQKGGWLKKALEG